MMPSGPRSQKKKRRSKGKGGPGIQHVTRSNDDRSRRYGGLVEVIDQDNGVNQGARYPGAVQAGRTRIQSTSERKPSSQVRNLVTLSDGREASPRKSRPYPKSDWVEVEGCGERRVFKSAKSGRLVAVLRES